MVGLLHHRHHVDAGERGLPAPLVVVLGDPDHPVRSVLAAQRPVGVGRVHRERGRLDPRLFGVGGVVDLGRVLVPLRPAQVHPQQVLREVGRVGPARLRVDRDQRLPRVVLAVQQRAHLELVDLGPQRGQLGRRLLLGGLVVLTFGQVEQHLGVAKALTQAGQPGQLRFQVGKPPAHLLRTILVRPQLRVGGLLAQISRFPLHFARIQHGLDAVERRGQRRDLIGWIGTCHAGKPNRAPKGSPHLAQRANLRDQTRYPALA